MKRFTALLLILLILVASVCGCSISSGAKTNGTDTPAEADVSYTPAEADASSAPDEVDYSYSLGTPVEFSYEDGKANYERVDGVSYQYFYLIGVFMDLTPVSIYAYTSLPSRIGDYPTEPVEFEGSSLYVDVCEELTDWHHPAYLGIRDAQVFGAFKDLILTLDFIDGTPEPTPTRELKVEYKLVSPDGSERIYSIFLDGRVSTDDGKIAASVLTEQQMAYFVAIFDLYARSVDKACPYNMRELGPRDAYKVETGDEVLYLTESAGDNFIRLISDKPSDEPDDPLYYEFGFRCLTRVNCGTGDHGAALITITQGDFYSVDSTSEESFNSWGNTYTLYADGTVVAKTSQMAFEGLGYRLAERLRADVYYVSLNRYDTNAVMEYLNSCREGSK